MRVGGFSFPGLLLFWDPRWTSHNPPLEGMLRNAASTGSFVPCQSVSKNNEDGIWSNGDRLTWGTHLFYYLPVDIIIIIMSKPPAWSVHDCPIPGNEAGSASPDPGHPAKTSAAPDCLWSESFICFIFISKNIRVRFLTANALMNLPFKMKMKAPVNYLLQHCAGQIKSLLSTRLVNVLIWGAVYQVHSIWNGIKMDHVTSLQISDHSGEKERKLANYKFNITNRTHWNSSDLKTWHPTTRFYTEN